MPPFTFSRFLVLVACILAAIIAVLCLLTSATIGLLAAIGWVLVVLAIYLASLLVP